DRLAAILEPFMAQNNVPGISVAVVRDGKITHETGFGRTAPGGVGGKLAPSAIVDTRFKQPASGLISTAGDLARFAVALYDGKLLSEASRRLLFSQQETRGGKPTGYSSGMMVGRSDNKWGQGVYHTGSMEGTTAFFYLIPERRYALVLLANRERYVRELGTLLPALNEALLGNGALPVATGENHARSFLSLSCRRDGTSAAWNDGASLAAAGDQRRLPSSLSGWLEDRVSLGPGRLDRPVRHLGRRRW
ncbi:MAG: serine hydrolase, partial [Thermoanaerobaculia bacterium]